ncbi:Lon protease [Alloscardovia macacae]|uniref:endopeptidase La n=2 Tax=Alloscardovia macacae TaxID=1160091 RepID=A0A261F246_9BIFI|nr:Lon protease [Alloscardovia macacae]
MAADSSRESAVTAGGSAPAFPRASVPTMNSSRRTPGRHRRLVLTCVLAVVMLLLSLQPTALVIELPGPTADVLGTVEVSASASGAESVSEKESKSVSEKERAKDSATKSATKTDIISISGIRTYKQKGQLRLVTVSSTGVPGYPAPAAAALWAWFDPRMAVMPQEVVYSVDTTPQDFKKEGDEEMTTAQDTASKVAVEYVKNHAQELGLGESASSISALSSAKIQLHIDDIGGPSAGMMYTLGIIAKLTPADETGGQKIAGTGTIEKDGTVGRIGGIQLKMLGAQRDGARYFLAPEGNCDEVVGHIPPGLEVYSVKTIDDAYAAVKAIGSGQASGLTRCAVK